MCYNCGCGLPDKDLGNRKNITDKTFAEAAKAAGQTVEEAKRIRWSFCKKAPGESDQLVRKRSQPSGDPHISAPTTE